MNYHNHLLETHGNNNLLSRYGEFDISKYPMYSAQGEQNFIDDIYNNLDVDEIDKPILPRETVNRSERVEREERDNRSYVDDRYEIDERNEIDDKEEKNERDEREDKEIEEKELKDFKPSLIVHKPNEKIIKVKEINDNKQIEEFTQLKNLLNKQLKERQNEKMLVFVAIIGICIILLINNKKH